VTIFRMAVFSLSLLACTPGGRDARAEADLKDRERKVAERLAEARSAPGETADEPIARWDLPRGLHEVSGLAVTADGRLLAHGDEQARIYEIDYRRGVVVKNFDVGSTPITGDFEAIAVAGARIFLVTSDATIYEIAEGAAGARVPFRMTRTDVPGCREIESATYDAATSSLVLACKTPVKGAGDAIRLYQWAVDGQTPARERVVIPLDALRARGLTGKRFSASDIARRPDNGNFVMVAGPERAYAEVTPAGEVVVARMLPKGHPQPEGVTVTADGLLLIADEGGKGDASLTVYPAALK
jgi:hypothetical protein